MLELLLEVSGPLGEFLCVVGNLSCFLQLSSSNCLLMGFLGSLLGSFMGSCLRFCGFFKLLDVGFSGCFDLFLFGTCLCLSCCDFIKSSLPGSLGCCVKIFDSLLRCFLGGLGCGRFLVGGFQPRFIFSSRSLKGPLLLLSFLSLLFSLLNGFPCLGCSSLGFLNLFLRLGQFLCFLSFQLLMSCLVFGTLCDSFFLGDPPLLGGFSCFVGL
jgi:hypothetical protein